MYTTYCIYAFVTACLVIATRICFMLFFPYQTGQRKSVRVDAAKTMIILGSGGHTGEMIRVLENLDFKNYSPRIYVQADTDELSALKVEHLEENNTDYKVIKIRRSREIHQSYYTSVYTTTRATLQSIPILWRERPDLLLCNGPGTCVPICLVAFLFKAFYIANTTIVFIESFCRVKSLSLTGRMLYYIVDYLIVQWPYLKSMYKKTLYL